MFQVSHQFECEKKNFTNFFAACYLKAQIKLLGKLKQCPRKTQKKNKEKNQNTENDFRHVILQLKTKIKFGKIKPEKKHYLC